MKIQPTHLIGMAALIAVTVSFVDKIAAGFGIALVAALVDCSSSRVVPTSTIARTTLSSSFDSPESLERIAWLKNHASALRTLDPADEDFADLAPIGRAIGNARVVFLGESGHGEGEESG